MRYLLDTHTLIWFLIDDPSIPPATKDEIRNINNECFVSIATLWEIGIKHSLKKLQLKTNLKEAFDLIQSYPFSILPVSPNHILQLNSLPLHHRDPFDRLLIAKAQTEKLVLISKDKVFSNYDVVLKWN